jgi:hypothetical protein
MDMLSVWASSNGVKCTPLYSPRAKRTRSANRMEWHLYWDSLNGTILAHQMPLAGAVHHITVIPITGVNAISLLQRRLRGLARLVGGGLRSFDPMVDCDGN